VIAFPLLKHEKGDHSSPIFKKVEGDKKSPFYIGGITFASRN
jgi:hypothetical protein